MLDFGTPGIAKFRLDRFELFADHFQQAVRILQDLDQATNGVENLPVFVGELFLFQSGQAVQPHRQDFQCLRFGQLITVVLQAVTWIH